MVSRRAALERHVGTHDDLTRKTTARRDALGGSVVWRTRQLDPSQPQRLDPTSQAAGPRWRQPLDHEPWGRTSPRRRH
jgi:hypothetical protein